MIWSNCILSKMTIYVVYYHGVLIKCRVVFNVIISNGTKELLLSLFFHA